MQHGIKAISMDDIAKAVGISKRTLYETFSSKDELVISCVEHINEERLRCLNDIFEQNLDFYDVILKITYEGISFIQSVSMQFLLDLSRFNYRTAIEVYTETVNHFCVKLQGLIVEGQRHGFIRPELDPALMSRILINKKPNALKDLAETSGYELRDILLQLVGVTLRGMSTPEGVKIIDERFNSETARKYINSINKPLSE
ncbi:MAG: TetR/AcrR family transcriptional regulator [Bacteroidales bacterium]|nr:TetR/AcrR family transcriptional regulator [Bacteroidales bacterium]